jgi:hypothetical protein
VSRSERGEGAGGGVRVVEIPRLFNVVYDMLLSRVGIFKVGSHNFLRLFCIFVKFVQFLQLSRINCGTQTSSKASSKASKASPWGREVT